MNGGDGAPRLRTFRAVALLVGWVVAFLLTNAVRAAPTIDAVAIGIAGAYRPDRWCPAEIRLAHIEADGDYRLDIDALDAAGRRIRYSATHRLSAIAENRVTQIIQLGRANEPLIVALHDANGRLIAERRLEPGQFARPLAEEESLTVVIGRLTGLDGVDALSAQPSRKRRYQRIASIAQLPSADRLALLDRSLALDAATTIVWMVGQSPAANASADANRLRLLDDWVRAGGRLIVSLGPHAAQELGESAILPGLNLGSLGERAELLRTSPLESFVGHEADASTARPSAESDERSFRLQIARLNPVEGKIVAAVNETGDRLPLIVHVPHGFGEVVVVAFDLSAPALVSWPGHTRLLAKTLAIVESDAPRDVAERPTSRAWAGKAYSSLSEQLADALDQFPGASPERFWYLTAAAIAYILVIGPLDWYLVRRRPEWTWATFLASVCLAAAGAYAIVHATKTDDVLVNQLRFVDVDFTAQAAARVRTVAWSSVYQPSAGIYEVATQSPPAWPPRTEPTDAAPSEGAPNAPRLSLWAGPSGQSDHLGPLAGRFDTREPAAIYDMGRGRIARLVSPAWSSRLFFSRSLADTQAPEVATLEADAFGRVVGSVRNPLDEPLERSVLFYGAYALALGTLEPGRTVSVDGRGDWRSAESYLTRQSLAQDRETAEKYDATAVDLGRIGEVVGFYEAAHGASYTGLANRDIAEVDLSRQLRLGRAILVGQSSTGANVGITPGPRATPHRQTTWWRFLLKPTTTLPSGQ